MPVGHIDTYPEVMMARFWDTWHRFCESFAIQDDLQELKQSLVRVHSLARVYENYYTEQYELFTIAEVTRLRRFIYKNLFQQCCRLPLQSKRPVLRSVLTRLMLTVSRI
jgi:hypothetical protein